MDQFSWSFFIFYLHFFFESEGNWIHNNSVVDSFFLLKFLASLLNSVLAVQS